MNKDLSHKKEYFIRLDYYKIILTLAVCVMHFENEFYNSGRRIFEGMYLAVDFFFILSGFFICYAYMNAPGTSAWEYLKKRFREFFSPTVIMLILFLAVDFYGIVKSDAGVLRKFLQMVDDVWKVVPEGLSLQMFLPVTMYNFPIWYISILIVIGTLLYAWLRKQKNNVQSKLPIMILIIIVLYGYFVIGHGNIDVHTSINPVFYIYDGVLRGTAGLMLGILVYVISKSRKADALKKVCSKKWLRILILLGMLWCMFYSPHSGTDFVFILFAGILIFSEVVSTQKEISKSRKRRISYARSTALYVYFVHYFICKKLWHFIHDRFAAFAGQYAEVIEIIAFVVLICAAGIIMKWFIDWFLRKLIFQRMQRRMREQR